MSKNTTPITTLLAKKGPNVFSTSPEKSVSDAVCEMNRQRVGCLVVLENDQLVGIFTERDVLTRVVTEAKDARETKVGDVMTPDPVILHADDTVTTVMEIMTENRTRHLPVFDSDEKLIGLLSIGDLTRWQMEENRAESDHLRQYVFGEYSA